MSDNVNGDVTTTTTTPPAAQVTDESVTTNTAAADDMVPKKELEAVIKESIKRKQELADLKKQMDESNKRLESFKTQGMKDKEMWKELAEQKEKEAKDLETKYSGLQNAIVRNEKFSALKTELYKLGIIPEALSDVGDDFIDMCEIETTSTGRHSVLNAKQVAETVKMKKPYIFGRPGNPNVNTTTPGVNTPGGAMTVGKVLELQKKYEKTKSEDDRKAYHDGMKVLSRMNQQH